MLWLLTLPFRIFFGFIFALVAVVVAVALAPLALLFWLPFVLLRGAFKLVGALLLVLAIAAGGVVLLLALLVPLIPVFLFVGGLWLIYRIARPRPVVAG